MSYLESEEFRSRHEQLRITSGMAAKAHARKMLELDSEAALAADVSQSLSPEAALEALEADPDRQEGDQHDGTAQEDQQG